MPQLRFKAGGVGEYFDGQIGDPARRIVKTVYVSTCAHCAAPTEFPSQKEMMDYVECCRGCMRLICLSCYGKPCVPQEKWAEMQEEEAKLRDKLQRQAWGCY